MTLTIKLSGTYCDPTGQPLPLVTVRFEAQQNSNQTYVALSAQMTTDVKGSYSIDLVPNMYLVTSGSRSNENVLGFITINADSPDGTLNEYLTSFVPDVSTPGILKEMEEILEKTKEVAGNAGVNPCGKFDSTVQYKKNDLVEYEGSQYRATVDVSNVAPPNEPWELFVSAGTDGGPGPANVLTIGAVTTLEPDQQATASITGYSPKQILNLGLPKGKEGKDGVVNWDNTSTFTEGSVVVLGKSLYLSLQDNANSRPMSSRESLYNWTPLVLNDAVTVGVPELFDNLSSAIAYFRNVESSSSITIQITGAISDNDININTRGDFTITGGELQLAEGCGITASGSGVNVRVNSVGFTGSGATLGAGLWSNTSVAVFSIDGANVTVDNIAVTDVYYGVQAARASLTGTNCKFTGAGDAGVLAFDGGQISLSKCQSNHAHDAKNELGWGYVAEAGASLWLQECSSTDNVEGGLFANIGGHIRDDNGTHTGNVRGCVIHAGSGIEVNGSNLSGSDTSNAEVYGGSLTAFNSKFDNSMQGQGVYCTGSGKAHLHYCETNDNTAFGLYAEQLSLIKLFNSHTSSGNAAGDSNIEQNILSVDGALICN